MGKKEGLEKSIKDRIEQIKIGMILLESKEDIRKEIIKIWETVRYILVTRDEGIERLKQRISELKKS